MLRGLPSESSVTSHSAPTGASASVSQIPLSGSSNVCYPAGCRVDADCGPGGYCSPSPTLGCCGGPSGFHCHTPQDSCLNDSDCADGGLFCLFVQTAWHCGTPQMCGC